MLTIMRVGEYVLLPDLILPVCNRCYSVLRASVDIDG